MVRKDIQLFLQNIPENVTVIAATKYVGVDDMLILLKNGITNFGENRVDSFLEKYNILKEQDVHWHFIGHLQRNKALKIIDKIECLHSLDSIELAKLINKHRKTPLDCFVEVSINNEATKNGVKLNELATFIQTVNKFENINIVGLMMMAIKDSDKQSLNKQFSLLRETKEKIEKNLSISCPNLSMGMSDDYEIAINEGATHIRLGRILFN
jgi:pyridoxal phosphate enzyme (YggS family)